MLRCVKGEQGNKKRVFSLLLADTFVVKIIFWQARARLSTWFGLARGYRYALRYGDNGWYTTYYIHISRYTLLLIIVIMHIDKINHIIWQTKYLL